MKTTLIISAFTCVLLSCTKEVDLKIPVVDSRLTLDARISVGEPISVLAGTASSILDDKEPGADNQNKVFLYSDEKLIDSLEPEIYDDIIPGIYIYRSTHIAAAGHEYKIVATRDGFEKAFGSDISPSAVDFQGLEIDTLEKRISFNLNDAPSPGDYYMMELYREDPSGKRASYHLLSSYDPTVEVLYSTGALENGAASGRRMVLSDEFFNGKQKEVVVYYDTTLSADLEYTFQLSHISRNFYQHERSRSVEKDTDLQIFGDKANLHSNVLNGYGIVACQNPNRRKFFP